MKKGKLVRDKIPEIISSNNETPVTRILSDLEYKEELEKKLYEELKNLELKKTGKIECWLQNRRLKLDTKIKLTILHLQNLKEWNWTLKMHLQRRKL